MPVAAAVPPVVRQVVVQTGILVVVGRLVVLRAVPGPVAVLDRAADQRHSAAPADERPAAADLEADHEEEPHLEEDRH